ncbi:MAG TPA: 4-(cytidine 5'-diphospho)-2-C-methyl-D-erythritol kinase [Stellaceae bacterium]|nr:4-(cytidine 5'-diphospho)-2-C-methyl-D-erythritol kinase [Stellaceae bacterium]
MTWPIERAAPAKVNLTLAVVGRRPDGYHLLDSLVGFTEAGDTIAVAPAETLSLSIDGPFGITLAGDVAENLVMRAARALADAAGIRTGAAIRLTKRLPIASGIGGGSSDAAATLRALARLWRLDLEPGALARIGLALGADIPVCLAGHPARLSGIGDRVEPGPDLPPAPLLLVNPGIGLPTPRVFAARRGAFSPPGPDHWPALPDAAALAAALAPLPNDLTKAAIGLLPPIASILDALAAAPGCLLARMSGSGATCFGLFTDTASLAAAATRLAAAHPSWWVEPTRLAAGDVKCPC